MLGLNSLHSLHHLTKSSILLDFTARSVDGFRASSGTEDEMTGVHIKVVRDDITLKNDFFNVFFVSRRSIKPGGEDGKFLK